MDDRVDLGFGVTVSRENLDALRRGEELARARLPVLRERWAGMTVGQLRETVLTFRGVRGMRVRDHLLAALESRVVEDCARECGYRREG